MKGTTVTVMLLIGAVFLTSLPLTADAVSGEDTVEVMGGTYYCYGDNPEFYYPNPEKLPAGVAISWHAQTPEGVDVACDPATGTSTKLNLTGLSKVILVQTLTYGEETKTGTIIVIPLHIADDTTYTVRFIDGTKVFDEETITRKTVCADGSNFFIIPSAPTKSGYTFEGWYTSESVKAESIVKEPVLKSIDFYAKWSSSGGSGGGSSTTQIVIDHDIIVTFDTVIGIEYNILTAGSGVVTFTVNAVGGFDMKMETLMVKVGDKVITPDGGNYIVTQIHEDTTIKITCDREEPEPTPQPTPSEPFNGLAIPWWVFIPVGLIAFSLVMIRWYRK